MGTSLKMNFPTCSCKLTITDRRNRLSAESIEVIELLHNWLASGIVQDITRRLAREEVMDVMEIE